MAYRNIIISQDCRLTVKNEQLIVAGKTEHRVPIEDIYSIVIESAASDISTYALSKLAQTGAAVFFCDEKHLPCGVLTSFNTYSRKLRQVSLQTTQTQPALKRIWQQIVKAKINNQAICLKLCGKEGGEKLKALANSVSSGDAENNEGVAAALYFRALFGSHFARAAECDTNAALNYGYAILRGCISRNVTNYGFEPCIGIHHRSELNNFNLSDDLIEPFRPIIDLYVCKYVGTDRFDANVKYGLVNLLNTNMRIGGQKQAVSYAIEKTVQSLSACFCKKTDRLLLPELVDFELHSYE